MSATEKFAGHWAEGHDSLHEWLCNKYQHTEIVTKGLSNTKTDMIGINADGTETRYSCKYVSSVNTHLHLTTYNKFTSLFPAEADIHFALQQWLGSHTGDLFETWKQQLDVKLSPNELRRQRIHSDNLHNWSQVLNWLNQLDLNRTLFQSLNNEAPVTRMVWINKIDGKIKVIDVNKLVEYMNINCEWQNSGSKQGEHTTLWYMDKLSQKRIMHLQMKGSGNVYGDYHGMMFHVYCNWPEEVVIHEEPNFWLR